MEGRILGDRYRVDALIGEGGLALVYRGTDLVLGRTVAIKILRPEYARDPEIVARFRSEARSAARLNHPNIVQIFDTGEEDETYYLVMEYLPEPDLKRIFEHYAPLPRHKVIDVIAQCCRALNYAHRAQIVHRDVKPQNILFTDDGIAKLSDFGIAAAVDQGSLSAEGKVWGSAAYISPEQAQGRPATPQSDIYSLGCVMYEALTGQPPFRAETPAELAAMHVRQRPVAPHIINPKVTAAEEFIVNKAMAKDLARRYQSADEMLADLEKLAASEQLDRTGVCSPRPNPRCPCSPRWMPARSVGRSRSPETACPPGPSRSIPGA